MNRHPLRSRDYLLHMFEAVRRVQAYVAGKSEADFLSDSLLQDAVIRNLEVLGEASNNLLKALPEAASMFPAIPFAVMVATRNRLSHGYFLINTLRVWEIVDRDLATLRTELEEAIKTWDSIPPQT